MTSFLCCKLDLSKCWFVFLCLFLTNLSSTSTATATEGKNSNDNNIKENVRRRLPVATPRIVGGKDALPGAYPFFAWWDIGCGATLISSRMLLSAAHCLEGNTDPATDDLGVVYLNSIDYRGGSAFEVVQVWVHTQYNEDHYIEPEWDFILLKINETVPQTVATPVLLNDNPNVPSLDDWLTKIGFGSTADTDDNSEILQQVSLPYVPTVPTCQELYADTTVIGEAELCTLHPNNSEVPRDSCYGDSGGPVLTQDNVQVGIISWGEGCGPPDRPAVNARVSAVASSWIHPLVCWNNGPPAPDYCTGMMVDLPLSLAVELYFSQEYFDNEGVDDDQFQMVPPENGTALLRRLNISWGLYKVSPPTIIYETEGGIPVPGGIPVEPSRSTDPPTTATTTTATPNPTLEDTTNPPLEEKTDPPLVSINRQGHDENNNNRRALRSVLTVSEEFENLESGRYYFVIHQEIQDILYRGTFDRIRIIQGNASIAQHLWLDMDGSNFAGLLEVYMDLPSSMDISELKAPVQGVMDPPDEEVSNGDDWVSDGFVDVYVDVMYDSSPEETSWWIRNLDTNRTVYFVEQGGATVPGLVGYHIPIPESEANDVFEFRIWDTSADGICCGPKGNGWVEIWVGMDDQMVQVPGNFTDEFSVELFF